MIPNIFISSTIDDLHHLRGSLRETILTLGYNPVMSEYAEVGYLPSNSAEESCYISIKQCHLAILVVGKRYGKKSKNGKSVTHNEFNSARENHIPLITFVDKEVLSFKQVFDINKDLEQKFPGMDAPEDTFTFLSDIMSPDINNGIIPFSSTSEAKIGLIKQMAYMFGDLLARKFDPINIQMQDVLSEVKTIRHEILKEKKGGESLKYLKATKFLLDQKDQNKDFRDFCERLVESIDEAIPLLIKANGFDEFVKSGGGKLTITETPPIPASAKTLQRMKHYIWKARKVGSGNIPFFDREDAVWVFNGPKDIFMNKLARDEFTKIHQNFVEITNK